MAHMAPPKTTEKKREKEKQHLDAWHLSGEKKNSQHVQFKYVGNYFGIKATSNSVSVYGQNASFPIPADLSSKHLAPCVHQQYSIFLWFLINHRW